MVWRRVGLGPTCLAIIGNWQARCVLATHISLAVLWSARASPRRCIATATITTLAIANHNSNDNNNNNNIAIATIVVVDVIAIVVVDVIVIVVADMVECFCGGVVRLYLRVCVGRRRRGHMCTHALCNIRVNDLFRQFGRFGFAQ